VISKQNIKLQQKLITYRLSSL